jgi:hypothetical protein
MRKILGDGWFQTFAAIAGLCLLTLAYDRLIVHPEPLNPIERVLATPEAIALGATPPVPTAPVPTAPAVALAAPGRAPGPRRAETDAAMDGANRSPVDMVRPPEEAAKPDVGADGQAEVPVAQNFAIYRIAPKKKGTWIVSGEDGPDVDSPSLARVIFSASDGDEIRIRPGVYAEPLEVKGKILIFRGMGARPEEVLLTSPDMTAVLKVLRGGVKLSNLRIEPEKGVSAGAAAVYASAGRVTLRGVVARSEGAALQAAQGGDTQTVIDVASSRLAGGYADMLIRGKARVAAKDVDFGNPLQPIVVWRDTAVSVKSSRFHGKNPTARLYVDGDSSIAVEDSPTAPPVARRSDADAVRDKAHFSASGQPVARIGAAAANGGPKRWYMDIFRPKKGN